MSDIFFIVMLFAAGAMILVAELFIPSHGVLTVIGIGLLIGGVVETFRYAGETAGIVASVGCLVAIPAFLATAVRIWPRTWIGKLIAPPNPTVTARDSSVPVEELSRFIGRSGTAVSTLRPVGICEFDGRRISCVAEYGMIDAGTQVEALRVNGANLAVQAAEA
ncbi:MAG: hypothetical protein HY287_14905 [Planctomycetes bacterium]|nr:hypothetical protein [Planctomycetota bacterium]MBI3835613.1 hypothetical protein [Planctomycetota bacterium]